jgi:hypothetical protein
MKNKFGFFSFFLSFCAFITACNSDEGLGVLNNSGSQTTIVSSTTENDVKNNAEKKDNLFNPEIETLFEFPHGSAIYRFYSDNQKITIFGTTEPIIKFKAEYIGGGNDIIEIIYEDEYFVYSFVEEVSHQCLVTFEDGRIMSVKEAIGGGYITGKDLILNDMPMLWVKPK